MIERRAERRYALSFPIMVRVPALGSLSVGETRVISTRGVYFILEHPPVLGAALDFTMRLSAEMTGGSDVFIHCAGKVLRIDDRRGPGFGIAAAIEQYAISRDNGTPHLRRSEGTAKLATQWNLSGTYFESCNCDVVCPCTSLNPPTTGECTVLVGWHIEKGIFGDTILDGLNVAVAVHSPGSMLQAKWKAAVYIDERANPPQREALGNIFSGRGGEYPLKFVMLIGDLLGVRSVPIEYHAEGKRRRLQIPNIAEAEIEGVPGYGDSPVTVANRPLCFAPGYRAEVAKSKHLAYSDYGFKWEITEKNGFFSPFHYVSQ